MILYDSVAQGYVEIGSPDYMSLVTLFELVDSPGIREEDKEILEKILDCELRIAAISANIMELEGETYLTYLNKQRMKGTVTRIK